MGKSNKTKHEFDAHRLYDAIIHVGHSDEYMHALTSSGEYIPFIKRQEWNTSSVNLSLNFVNIFMYIWQAKRKTFQPITDSNGVLVGFLKWVP